MSTRAFALLCAACLALFLVVFLTACGQAKQPEVALSFASDGPIATQTTAQLYLASPLAFTQAATLVVITPTGRTVLEGKWEWDGKGVFLSTNLTNGIFHRFVVRDSCAEYSVAGTVVGGRLLPVK